MLFVLLNIYTDGIDTQDECMVLAAAAAFCVESMATSVPAVCECVCVCCVLVACLEHSKI